VRETALIRRSCSLDSTILRLTTDQHMRICLPQGVASGVGASGGPTDARAPLRSAIAPIHLMTTLLK